MHNLITSAIAAKDIDWPVSDYVAIADPSAGPRMRMPSLDGKFSWLVFKSGGATYVMHPGLQAEARCNAWFEVTVEPQRILARYNLTSDRDRVEFMLRWSEHVLDHPRWRTHGLPVPHSVIAESDLG